MTSEQTEVKEKLWNSNYTKVWIANFMIFFSFMLLAPMLPLYMSDTFDANKDIIGIVLSGYTLTALLIRPFSGFLVDSFPRKKVLLICYFLFFIFFAGYLAAGTLLIFAIVRTLHGAPFGATTVSNSTVAIDVLHPSRRAEGIGYYGLSNNIASAIGPSVAIWIHEVTGSYDLIFLLSLLFAGIGFAINSTLKLKPRDIVQDKPKLSFDRFFLVKGWSEALAMVCYAFSYGVIATYIAIYGKEELGITGGSGVYFILLSAGLIMSRLIGNRTLREGKIVRNASLGICVSVVGYLVFAALHNPVGFYASALIIGLGNGHMWPAFQTMFINLAPHTQRGTANSSILISWDIGVGLGILVGGVFVEHFGYHSAFWAAWILNAVGVIFYFAYVRNNYLKNRLR
ncbi:MAG: MFS transporter [Bacteroidales bacterium]|nr:MFS transporter [Bacteroidales bacterium]MBQ4475148.1 MFS transporter [Bacteroidales bacterium]MBQ6276304.1 MFS transporter [Bacteroidales bacterium]MBR3797932.1 MFS transporter [Bacteroidales bacterium]